MSDKRPISDHRPTGDHRRIKDKRVASAPQPALAQMLFAAMNEHEAVLARISRLLHDDVSQILSAVGLQLDAMRMDFREQAPGVDGRASEIQELLEQAIEQLREITNELNPSIVERAGLQFALDRLIGKVRSGFAGTVRFHFDASLRVPTILAKAFYKIADYALDVAKTAPGCSLIDIHVKRAQGEYVLEISDNARVDQTGPAPLGQLLMDYYASKNHVTLRTERVPGKGSMVRASFPLPAAAIEGAPPSGS
jgi:signal transduction histidine kinase